MNAKLVLAEITLCAALVALCGCSKEQPATDTQTPTANQGQAPAAAQAVETATTAAGQAVEAAKSTAAQLTNQAATAVQAATQQAQTLIDKAKGLLADNKYQEALASLGQLKNLQLTAEQQKLVDDLKAKIQAALTKAATTDPASALGGALGGKK